MATEVTRVDAPCQTRELAPPAHRVQRTKKPIVIVNAARAHATHLPAPDAVEIQQFEISIVKCQV